MARRPCAGVRATRPGRARSLEVARCDRHRHRARHGPEPRLARAARRFLDLAERCAAVPLGGARFRQAVPAPGRVPFRGAARERRVRARGVLAALPGGARLDARGGPTHHIGGGVLSISWPLALYVRSPELFRQWWTLASQPQGALGTNVYYFLSTASWFAWPAWPLAAWAVWSMRRRLGEPRLFVPAFASLATLFGAAYLGPPQDVKLLALLAPLALLASQGVLTLRRGAAAALDWFGVITFAFFVGLIWLGYMGMMTGVPPRVAANFVRAAPGFTPQFNLLCFLFAAALTLAWFYIVLFA